MKDYSLLISKEQLSNRTVLNDNLDFNFVLPYVFVAQDLDLVPVLGQALMDNLMEKVKLFDQDPGANPISTDDKILLEDYIAPFLAYALLVRALPGLAIKLVDSGVVQRLVDDGSPLSLEDIDKMVGVWEVVRDPYKQKVIDYLCANADLYPTFKESKTWELGPSDYNFNLGLGLTGPQSGRAPRGSRSGPTPTPTPAGLTEQLTSNVNEGFITIGQVFPIGTSFTEMWKLFIAQALDPTKTDNSEVLSGITAQTLEIGTNFLDQLISIYSQGIIQSANGAPDVPLTGAATSAVYSGPGVNPVSGAIDTDIVIGSNQWSIVQDFAAETATYFDSDGNPSTIFDGDRGPGSLPANSAAITGKYQYWFSVGSIPTSSAGVRALPDFGFYPISQFDIAIAIGQTLVAFYLPDTVSAVTVLYVESSFADVTSTFILVPMNVDDAGANPVGYNRYEATIPGIGYPDAATYRVLITP